VPPSFFREEIIKDDSQQDSSELTFR